MYYSNVSIRICPSDTKSLLIRALSLDELSDNRDRTILPNYQPAAEPSIFEQTQIIPETDQAWLVNIAGAYDRLLNLGSSSSSSGSENDTKSEESSSRMTGVEAKFCEWSRKVADWLSGKESKVEDAVITGFLKGSSPFSFQLCPPDHAY